jgi:hypothetical protein
MAVSIPSLGGFGAPGIVLLPGGNLGLVARLAVSAQLVRLAAITVEVGGGFVEVAGTATLHHTRT